MKGIVILGVLIAAIGGSLWLLFRPSDRDLRRLEADCRSVLGQVSDQLNEASAALNRLRASRPNLVSVDQQMAGLRRRRELLDQELARQASESPPAKAERAPLIDARKKLGDDARGVLAAAAELREKIGVLDDFVRESLPRLQVMLLLSQEMTAAKEVAAARAAPLEDKLRVKLESLVNQAASTRNLAGQVLDAGSETPDRLRGVALAAKNEIERIISEQQELMRQLKST